MHSKMSRYIIWIYCDDQNREFAYSEEQWAAGAYWVQLEEYRTSVEQNGVRLFVETIHRSEIVFTPQFDRNPKD